MKNTLLFLLFIFLSFSCSNDKIIGVDYDFINPEKNEPSLENQIIEHITNSIKYNPKNVYDQKELKENTIRLISKEIYDFVDGSEFDSINKSNDEYQKTNYFVEKIHQFILSKENELVGETEPFLSIENLNGKGEKNVEGTRFKPKFESNELSSYFDPESRKLVYPKEIQENGWSFSKLVLLRKEFDTNFHGNVKYHYLGVDKIAHEGKYFIGLPYEKHIYYSPSGELIHSENLKLTISSISENGIKLKSILHGDYMSKTNGFTFSELNGNYLNYGDKIGRPFVQSLNKRKIIWKRDINNFYSVGRKDKFKCTFFNNQIHGDSKKYELLYSEKNWVTTYEEDTIPTVYKFIHGKLDGRHKLYDIKTTHSNGVMRHQKIYSGYRTYKMGVLEGPYLKFYWESDVNPHKTIRLLSKGEFKNGEKNGEIIDITGKNIYDINTSSLNEKNVKTFTLSNYKDFNKDDDEIEQSGVYSHGKYKKLIKNVEVNVAFDLLLGFDERLGYSNNRTDYSRNNNIDLSLNNNNITVRPNSMYNLGYIKNRILYQIIGDIVNEGENYKGKKIDEWRKYIVIKDTPKSYTNVSFPYNTGDTIFLFNGTYHKEKKYKNLNDNNFFNTKLKDYTFINNNITSNLLPKYGSVSSDRYIISSFDNLINEYDTIVNQESEKYSNRTIRFFPNNKIIYRENGIENYETYNLKGDLVAKCCN